MEKNYDKHQLLRIMEDIYFCQDTFFVNHNDRIRKEGITHVITSSNHLLQNFFVSLIIPNTDKHSKVLASELCPKISDLLREVLLFKGKLLFVNDSTNYATNLIIFTLSYWFRCSVF